MNGIQDIDILKSIVDEFYLHEGIYDSCNVFVPQDDLIKQWSGYGIVIPSGGIIYLTNAYMCIKYLREYLHCKLPIEVWYLNKQEIDNSIALAISRITNVKLVDASSIRRKYPMKNLQGWELKIYALLHSSFKDVLLLDSDCFLFQKPENLFNHNEYIKYRAWFSCDIDNGNHIGKRNTQTLAHVRKDLTNNKHLIPKLGIYSRDSDSWDYSRTNPLWQAISAEEDDLPEFESGFIMVDKHKHIQPLLLTRLLNEYSNITYNYIYGDKDTYHLAWSKYGHSCSLITDLKRNNVMIHSSLDDKILFQHRVLCGKFDPYKTNTEFPNKIKSYKHTILLDLLDDARRLLSSDLLINSHQISEYTIDHIDLINRLVNDNRITRMLEIGCGTNPVIGIMEDKNISYTGIDISKDAIDYCNKKYAVNNAIFQEADIVKCQHTIKYDLVFIKHTLQNLSNQEIDKLLRGLNYRFILVIEQTTQTTNDISTGDYRSVNIHNLFKFNLPQYTSKTYITKSDTCYLIEKHST